MLREQIEQLVSQWRTEPFDSHAQKCVDLALGGLVRQHAALFASAEELLEACGTADEAICEATFVRGTDQRSLNYASKKCRAVITKCKQLLEKN